VLNHALVVAGKELTEHTRDTRSLMSTALYALMGPAVVLIAFAAKGATGSGASAQPWAVMSATFALIAVFTGATAVATDMIAGERERRSLVPLLVSSPFRGDIVIGKWLAASAFAASSVLLSVIAFRTAFAAVHMPLSAWPLVVVAAPPLLSLALLAAAVEILVSMLCRTSKEAQTYLSMLHRQVIVLTLEGLSYKEIAQVLGIGESNVGVRLNRARQALRTLLEDHT
jgi:ABC-type transport system involved in multi-copper enzyme maturation permease subunit